MDFCWLLKPEKKTMGFNLPWTLHANPCIYILVCFRYLMDGLRNEESKRQKSAILKYFGLTEKTDPKVIFSFFARKKGYDMDMKLIFPFLQILMCIILL